MGVYFTFTDIELVSNILHLLHSKGNSDLVDVLILLLCDAKNRGNITSLDNKNKTLDNTLVVMMKQGLYNDIKWLDNYPGNSESGACSNSEESNSISSTDNNKDAGLTGIN